MFVSDRALRDVHRTTEAGWNGWIKCSGDLGIFPQASIDSIDMIVPTRGNPCHASTLSPTLRLEPHGRLFLRGQLFSNSDVFCRQHEQ